MDDDVSVIRRLIGAVEIRPLVGGLDHRAYAVGSGLVARFGAGVAAEAALLEAVAGALPLPVPRPVAVDDDAGCAVFERLVGASLLEVPSPDRVRFGPALLDFAAAVHALTPAAQEDATPPGEWLDEARSTWPEVRPLVPADLHAPIETFLATPPPAPARTRCFIHGDLGAEHVFTDGERITGVIDWGDAAIGDPALDHGRLARDFDTPADERARFYAVCTALEDLAFGREPYVANALAALRALRGGDDRVA